LSIHFKDRPEIGKKHQKKKLMPFIIYNKELLEKSNGDPSVLDQHLSFDEYEILTNNSDYIKRSLDLENIQFRLTDTIEEHEQINIDDILPGKPFIQFRHEQPITI